jgi:hypothetical protein
MEPDRASAVQRDLDELAGRPLTSHEVVVELIGATTTRTGLRVRAELDCGRYALGAKVRDERSVWTGSWFGTDAIWSGCSTGTFGTTTTNGRIEAVTFAHRPLSVRSLSMQDPRPWPASGGGTVSAA